MRVLVIGGTGFIGKELCKELKAGGHEVLILARNVIKTKAVLEKFGQVMEWPKPPMLPDNLGVINAVINLAGESIGEGCWTEAKKQRILNSRIRVTKEIIRAIENKLIAPQVFINASAIGYYGPRADEILTENELAGGDFLAEVCKQWEAEAMQAKDFGVRVAAIRIGVVLGKEGALPKMLLPFKFYLGGPIGTGKQWLSWIHIRDLVRIFRFVLENEISGPVNGTAPEPLTMKEFCQSLGKVLGRPSWLTVPGFSMRLALGEKASLLLYGQRVVPRKVLDQGFEFIFSSPRKALEELLG
jgi:uncharacterized protein